LWERKHHDNQNQKWSVEGHFIVSRASGLVLDVNGGSHQQGAHLIVWPRKHHDNFNQRFSFVPNFEFLVTKTPQVTIIQQQQYTPPPQQYMPQNFGQPPVAVVYENSNPNACFIRCHDTGFVLDVKGGNFQPGTHIVLWHKKFGNDAFNQKWVITPEGFLHLQGYPHLVLDVEGNGGAGTRVILWERKHHNNENQRWFFEGQFIVSRASGLVLDVEGGSHQEGAHLIVWQRKHHDNLNQRFSFVQDFQWSSPVIGYSSPPVAAYVSPPIASYMTPVGAPIIIANSGDAKFIRCHDTGFVLDVQHGNIRAGTHIILWHKKHGHEANNQKWVITSEGFIHLQGHPHLVLDIEGGGGKGSKVILWEKKHHDNANQRWHIDGHFIVSRSHHGLVLDVEGGSHREGAHLIVWDKKHFDNHNQKFSFVHGW